MEIYLLIRIVDYEGSDVIGVYSTPEKAKNMDNLKGWGVDSLIDNEWLSYGEDAGWVRQTKFGRFSIDKWDVE